MISNTLLAHQANKHTLGEPAKRAVVGQPLQGELDCSEYSLEWLPLPADQWTSAYLQTEASIMSLSSNVDHQHITGQCAYSLPV